MEEVMPLNLFSVMAVIMLGVLVTMAVFISYVLIDAYRQDQKAKREAAKPVVTPISEEEIVHSGDQKGESAANQVLRLALEKAGFCVWKVGKKEEQLGDYLGVNLDWPELPHDKLEVQVGEIRDVMYAVGDSLGFHPVMAEPGVYAGGAMAVVCGFANEEYIAKNGVPGRMPNGPLPVPHYECTSVPWPKELEGLRNDDAFKDKKDK